MEAASRDNCGIASSSSPSDPAERVNPEQYRPSGLRRIAWWQLGSLIITSKLSVLTTYAPITNAVHPIRDAWLSALVAAAIAFLVAWIALALAARFPGETLFSYVPRVLGPWAGRPLVLALVVYWAVLLSYTLRQFALTFNTALLPETPTLVVELLVLLSALYLATGGFEVVARGAEVMSPLLLFLMLMLMALVLPQGDWGRLRPVLGDGLAPVWRQALTPIAIFGESAWVVLLGAPFLPATRRQSWRAVVLGLGASSVVVSLSAAMLVALFGVELLGDFVVPTVMAAQLIQYGQFVERVEWLLAVLWAGAIWVRVALLLYATAAGLASVLGPDLARDYRTLLPAAALIALIPSSILFPDTQSVVNGLRPTRFAVFSLPFEALVPLLVLAAAVIRRVKALPEHKPGPPPERPTGASRPVESRDPSHREGIGQDGQIDSCPTLDRQPEPGGDPEREGGG